MKKRTAMIGVATARTVSMRTRREPGKNSAKATNARMT